MRETVDSCTFQACPMWKYVRYSLQYSRLISTWSETLNLLGFPRFFFFCTGVFFQHRYHAEKRLVVDSTKSFKVFWLELLIARVGHGFGLYGPYHFYPSLTSARTLMQLSALQCKYGQGYFFSRPLNTQAAGALIAESLYGMDKSYLVAEYLDIE